VDEIFSLVNQPKSGNDFLEHASYICFIFKMLKQNNILSGKFRAKGIKEKS